jgi:hypothetical protein
VVAHRREQGVSLVVATAKAEQEGSEDTVRDQFRYGVRYVRSAYLSKVALDE